MSSAPAIELRLRRSGWRRRFFVSGYLLAAVAWLAAGLHWVFTAAGLALLTAGLWRDWRAPWPQQLRFRPDAGWQVVDSRGRTLSSPGVYRARTGRFVTSITWRPRRGGSLALFDDAFCDNGHTRLRRLLRHSDTSAPW